MAENLDHLKCLSGPPLVSFTVSVAALERLRALCQVPHEHGEGMNECSICDKPLIDAAIDAIEGARHELRLAFDKDLVLSAAREQEAEIEKLQRFVGNVLASHRENMADVDGGNIQDWALECGLLETRDVTEPCGESCACAEASEFPTKCHFLSELGKAAIETAIKHE